MVRHRVATRHLTTVFRGVFLVGHLATNEFTLPTAALLAAGPRGTLSYHAAGALRTMWPSTEGIVDVTIPGARRKPRPGWRPHSDTLKPHEMERLHGLLITTATRTVLDLASVIPLTDIPRLVEQALIHDHVTTQDLLKAAVEAGPRRGVPVIRDMLSVPDDLADAKSRAELRLRAIVREANLPQPQSNILVAGKQFDIVWPEHRLIAEYDSWRYHKTPERFANDRRKHNAAQAAGFAVFRYTDADLLRPLALAVQLGTRLRP
jgi:very-short-patch-repair endonuclease